MNLGRDAEKDEALLVYDRQCPVCDLYCRAVYKAVTRPLRLIDARSRPAILKEISAHRIDIDQNMVLKVGSELYAGHEAIHKLALMSAAPSLFQRLNTRMFRSERRAELVYPLFRRARNVLLRLLGRTKINNLGLPNNERF